MDSIEKKKHLLVGGVQRGKGREPERRKGRVECVIEGGGDKGKKEDLQDASYRVVMSCMFCTNGESFKIPLGSLQGEGENSDTKENVKSIY